MEFLGIPWNSVPCLAVLSDAGRVVFLAEYHQKASK